MSFIFLWKPSAILLFLSPIIHQKKIRSLVVTFIAKGFSRKKSTANESDWI